MGGKADWVAAGLPVEGDHAGRAAAMTLLRTDVATCGPGERAADLPDAIAESPVPFAVVVDGRGVVLGKVRRGDAEAKPDATAADLLVEGPTSTRADVDVTNLAERMQRADTRTVLVTTGQGELLGVLVREDLLADAAGVDGM